MELILTCKIKLLLFFYYSGGEEEGNHWGERGEMAWKWCSDHNDIITTGKRTE